MSKTDLIILIGQSNSGALIANQLKSDFEFKIIREQRVPTKKLVKRRVKKLGVFKVFGQLLFKILIEPLIKNGAEQRILQIEKEHQVAYDLSCFDVRDVSSVNSQETLDLLKKLKPKVVLVIGTRIIGSTILSSIDAKFVNVHAGITPLFRGVHGGYWAKTIGKEVGTTIHYIDKGIDTGQVISQTVVKTTKNDSFSTYPLLQMVSVIPELKRSLVHLLQGEKPSSAPLYENSSLWTHPTIFQYLYYYFFKGVK